MLVAVAVGLLVAGGIYYVNFQRTVTIQAVNRLESIHQTIAISAFEDAKAQLSTFLDQFDGTDQAREAVILLGRLHLESGDAAVAISVLERADLGFRDPLGIQANSLLARAYENQGRWPEAEDTLFSRSPIGPSSILRSGEPSTAQLGPGGVSRITAVPQSCTRGSWRPSKTTTPLGVCTSSALPRCASFSPDAASPGLTSDRTDRLRFVIRPELRIIYIMLTSCVHLARRALPRNS